MQTNQLKTVLNAVAMGMGVAVIVLNIINPLSLTAVTSLLAIGVAALRLVYRRTWWNLKWRISRQAHHLTRLP
jgi:hypothetical protein